MPRQRCPNGSRRDKFGICVRKKATRSKSISKEKEKSMKSNPKNTTTKRCPNGSRRDKSGECVSYNTTKKKKSSERETPRSIYAKSYFANNKTDIHLLDKIEPTDTSVMFQVNYNDVSQFTNHVNLSHSPLIDCFFQSIFSLGLRDVTMAKNDAENINTKGIAGVDTGEVEIFIKNAFNLAPNEYIQFRMSHLDYYIKQKKSQEFINRIIQIRLGNELKDGYATVLYVERYISENGNTGGHYIVVYKYNNTIYFFDPQKNSRYNTLKGGFNSTNIYEVLDTEILYYGIFTVYNLKSLKPLVNTSCPIKYIG